jgi:hypothetical protein
MSVSGLEFQNNDLVFYQHGGKIMSGGYTVNSILMNSGQPLLNSYFGGSKTLERQHGNNRNNNNDDDEDDEDDEHDDEHDDEITGRNKHFDNLAVPVGIFYIHNNQKSEYDDKLRDHNNYKQCEMLSDDIYDKLFELASYKQSTNKNNKTPKDNKDNKDNKVKKNTKKNNKQELNNENVSKKNKTKRSKKELAKKN